MDKGMTMLLPIKTNVLYKIGRWAVDSGHMHREVDIKTETEDLNEADVVTSKYRVPSYRHDEALGMFVEDEPFHTPVLDIDVPAQLVQSSTPGKHHLYIDAPMTWDTYVKLLDAMQAAGILEPGYVSASKERGFTAVRLPWVSK
jgi:hypothetical protein